MTSTSTAPGPSIAVWYFVGATFVFAAPVIFFPEAPWWVRLTSITVGLVVTVLGGIQLGREIRQQRTNRDAPPDAAADD